MDTIYLNLSIELKAASSCVSYSILITHIISCNPTKNPVGLVVLVSTLLVLSISLPFLKS